MITRKCDTITYVGPIMDHGSTLGLSGSAFVMLLSACGFKEVKVVCPIKNHNSDDNEPEYPKEVKVLETYEEMNVMSEFRAILKLIRENHCSIVFNAYPTSQGKTVLANLVWILAPMLARLNCKDVKVIWHNSVYTNEFMKLGYVGFRNRIKASALMLCERLLFKMTDVFVLSDHYKALINSRFRNRVSSLPLPFIESLSVVDCVKLSNLESFRIERDFDHIPTIHLHGNWGPQKNVEHALNVLERLQSKGLKFKLLLSGSINRNFDGFQTTFWALVERHKNMLSKVIVPVTSSMLFSLFTETDIVILPYNASGGRSGVMDIASFFGCTVICPPFPEYEEQSCFYQNVRFADLSALESAIAEELVSNRTIFARVVTVKKNKEQSLSIFKKIMM